MDYTVVVVTEGNDPPGLAYIAPYAATSIAEHFMEAGRDVLIVYDDLTHHAACLSRAFACCCAARPVAKPFPAISFTSTRGCWSVPLILRDDFHGGSLTALPIIETEAQNISAYIPTNLISITDGQIYLSPTLFELGILPAVDVGKSVSRVGGKAQRAAYRAVAGDLKLAYAQFTELESFAKFGTRLDDTHPQDHRPWPANPGHPQTTGARTGIRPRTNRHPRGLDRRSTGQCADRQGARCRAGSEKGGGGHPG